MGGNTVACLLVPKPKWIIRSDTQHPGPPLLLRVCAQLPLQFLSLCHSEHSSTQLSLTLGLRLSPSGRTWFLYCMWLQNLCCFPSRWPSGLSEGAMGLLQDTGHIKKGQGTVWFHRSSSQSETPPLRVSLGLLAESPSLHCFLLGERKKKKPSSGYLGIIQGSTP